MRDRVSHSYKTPYKIIGLYILIVIGPVFDNKRDRMVRIIIGIAPTLEFFIHVDFRAKGSS